MSTKFAWNWWIGEAGSDTLSYDPSTPGNVTFQLGGSGGVGGVRNGFDIFIGSPTNWDKIYVAPTSGYAWTAVMIANNGLSNVDQILFGTTGPKPIYFTGNVNFSSIVSMDADAKIFGRAGNDNFQGGALGEYVQGDGGNDTLFGNGGNDILHGDTANGNPWVATWVPGDDFLYGGVGNDKLFGDGGNDTLFGGDDNDLLDGGAGTNHIWGGAGIDTFQISNTSDHSVIEDFDC